MEDERDQHPGKHGLPGNQEHNREEQEPAQPARKDPSQAEGGDPDSGGESGEGSQSTGNPHGAG